MEIAIDAAGPRLQRPGLEQVNGARPTPLELHPGHVLVRAICSVVSAAPIPKTRRATRPLVASTSRGSFSAAEATTLGGSSGEKIASWPPCPRDRCRTRPARRPSRPSPSDEYPARAPPERSRRNQAMQPVPALQATGLAQSSSRDRSCAPMQNLRDKLLKAGLVTEDQAKNAESTVSHPRERPPQRVERPVRRNPPAEEAASTPRPAPKPPPAEDERIPKSPRCRGARPTSGFSLASSSELDPGAARAGAPGQPGPHGARHPRLLLHHAQGQVAPPRARRAAGEAARGWERSRWWSGPSPRRLSNSWCPQRPRRRCWRSNQKSVRFLNRDGLADRLPERRGAEGAPGGRGRGDAPRFPCDEPEADEGGAQAAPAVVRRHAGSEVDNPLHPRGFGELRSTPEAK